MLCAELESLCVHCIVFLCSLYSKKKLWWQKTLVNLANDIHFAKKNLPFFLPIISDNHMRLK